MKSLYIGQRIRPGHPYERVHVEFILQLRSKILYLKTTVNKCTFKIITAVNKCTFKITTTVNKCTFKIATTVNKCTFKIATTVNKCTFKIATTVNKCTFKITTTVNKCTFKIATTFHFIYFIPAISIAPLQVLYYSKALPTTARILYQSFTPKRTGNCR